MVANRANREVAFNSDFKVGGGGVMLILLIIPHHGNISL